MERASGEEIFTLRILRSITARSSQIDSAWGNKVREKETNESKHSSGYLGSQRVCPPCQTLLQLSAAVHGAHY